MSRFNRNRNPPLSLQAGYYIGKTSDNGDTLFNSAQPLTLRKPIIYDSFNRADSATAIGNADTTQAWTALVGTWGISSNRVYSATDASGDIAIIDVGRGDFNLICTTNGQTTGLTNNRLLNVLFRGLDAQNFLMTRIANSSIQLFKSSAGSVTQIATVPFSEIDNTDYEFMVNCFGNRILIFVGGILRINYTLIGGDTVFAGYTKVGLRVTKAGAPTGIARADKFLVEAI